MSLGFSTLLTKNPQIFSTLSMECLKVINTLMEALFDSFTQLKISSFTNLNKNANSCPQYILIVIKPRSFTRDFAFNVLAIANYNAVKFTRLTLFVLFYQNNNSTVVSQRKLWILKGIQKSTMMVKNLSIMKTKFEKYVFV